MSLVGIIGEREASPENSLRAYTVGRLLAEQGFALICGGLGGVMEAACRGACDAGGLTLGILPGVDAAEANPYVQIAIVTGLNEARNLLIVRSALVLIAIGGEYGTLSEMAFALKMHKPVITLHSWQPERPGVSHPTLFPVQTPEEAIELLLRLIGRQG
ncbi:MAG: TIGR00725 family protein [Coprothermobacterota bacterium]|nr:TIGR00725 family protein [Coprothermobacterota bacterium]